ncbi:hypothetical protein HK097_005503, partial [Rhizophlyctis rosea]
MASSNPMNQTTSTQSNEPQKPPNPLQTKHPPSKPKPPPSASEQILNQPLPNPIKTNPSTPS